MRHIAVALLLMLLALPAAAQVEIRGLTIAPPDRPGNGSIMLKGVISTRLPGEIYTLTTQGHDVFIQLDARRFRLFLRNGELVRELAEPADRIEEREYIAINVGDFDRDGRSEAVRFLPWQYGMRMALWRFEDGRWREIASVSGFGDRRYASVMDLTRSGKSEIITIGDADNCIRVFSFADDKLHDLGSLSCGMPVVGHPMTADMDGDGRFDLVVARQQGRIEIFLR